MTLSELRTEFTNKSGRADLVTAEIDKYIQRGQKYLDDLYGLAPFDPPLPLEDAADSNSWSEDYPHVLIWAALFILENDYRNTEGANDWRKSIESVLVPADHTRAEEEADGITVMEG